MKHFFWHDLTSCAACNVTATICSPALCKWRLAGLPGGFLYYIYRIFGQALRSLVTFDPLTCNWGHGSPMSWMGFLPANLQLAVPFHLLDLESGTGQTDRERQTDSDQCIMPPFYGTGHSNFHIICSR